MDSSPNLPPDPDIDDAHVAIIWLWVWTLAVVALAGALLVATYFSGEGYATIVMMVFAASTAGGLVNAMRRYGRSGRTTLLPASGARLDPRTRKLVIIAYSSVTPTACAIIGLAIYMAFAGEIISGPMFPKFFCRDLAGSNDFVSFLRYYQPTDPADYAKALFWAFLSGYSEKFVSNALDNVAGGSDR